MHLWTSIQDPEAYRHNFPLLGIAATLLGSGMTWHAWRSGAKRVLWSTRAREVKNPDDPKEKMLLNVVEEMAIASGLPRPKVWIVPDPDPNAFATGMDEKNAHVAVTQGLLDTLNRDELQGVIAHEMAHIKSHDTRLMTLLAALVGTIALISDAMARILRSSPGRSTASTIPRRSGGKKDGLGALAVVILAVWLLTLILAPLISQLLAMAVSRKREFLADAMAAQFTRNPAALASALRKIEDAAQPTASIHRGTAHLCIADPMGRRVTHRQGLLADLLATHPPMAVRIARLKAMAYQNR
ncbi:MAG: protease HtpX [Gemmatimonadales bacterium]|nr:Protease HtpX [bacterium HR33]GIW52250.1 MAG: protease HtpX [Gemmatimonadales bacterium]